jgi:hypothetical protein
MVSVATVLVSICTALVVFQSLFRTWRIVFSPSFAPAPPIRPVFTAVEPYRNDEIEMILTLIRWRERLSALDHGKCFLVEGCVAGARNNVTRNHLALPINLEGYLCKTGLPRTIASRGYCLFIVSRATRTRSKSWLVATVLPLAS